MPRQRRLRRARWKTDALDRTKFKHETPTASLLHCVSPFIRHDIGVLGEAGYGRDDIVSLVRLEVE